MSNWNSGEVREVVALRSGDMSRCPCGCDEVELKSACHPDAGLTALFDHGEKVLLLVCGHKDCGNLTVKLKVADGKAAPGPPPRMRR